MKPINFKGCIIGAIRIRIFLRPGFLNYDHYVFLVGSLHLTVKIRAENRPAYVSTNVIA